MKFYKHPAYIGYANQEMKEKDLKAFEKQFQKDGFDNTVTWNLDNSIIQFIYPRLKRYRKIAFKVIKDDELQADIDIMLKEFKFYLNDESQDYNKEHFERFQKALDLLHKNFHKLWW